MSPTDTPVFPPTDGSVTLPEVIDFNLKYNPNHSVFAFSTDEEPESVVSISQLEFDKDQPREVVAVIALVDIIVYQAVVVGLMRAGVVPFPVSHRNSARAIVHLLRETDCHRIITTPATLGSLIDEVIDNIRSTDAEFSLNIETVPTLQQIYPKLGTECSADPFETHINYQRKQITDIALYLHSSGSTGLPKVIPVRHQALVEWATMLPANFRDYKPRLRLGGMSIAPFHSMATFVHIISALYGVMCITLLPPVVHIPTAQPHPLSPDHILEHMRRTKSNGLAIVPSLLQGLAESEEGMEMLKSCDLVGYGGGHISQQLGDSLVSAGVTLRALFGATEFGATSLLKMEDDAATWGWIQFSDRVNLRWAPQGDGTFEAQYLTCETHHPCVENMEDPRGYASSDLFIQHPTNKKLWKFVSRIDDVVVHLSGEKTVPAPMEAVIMRSPMIQAVVIFGNLQDQTGVLIQPTPELVIDISDQQALAKLRNILWPVIEAANQEAPAFSRIFKEMILITSPEKPLPRSNKGNVVRKNALKIYETEIQHLYATIESNTDSEEISVPKSWDKEGINNWLIDQAKNINQNREILPLRDLFEQGFDSLSATFLRLRILGALSRLDSAPELSTKILQNVVYTHPTVDELSKYIVHLLENPGGSTKTKNSAAFIEGMISKYSIGLDAPLPLAIPDDINSTPACTVLITGTTGSLGSDILALLLRDGSVQRIYALNRSGPKSLLARHEDRFVDKGLDERLLSAQKLVLLEGDTSQRRLGLAPALYDEIRNSATLIIHAAWRVDFNLTLVSFERNIQGTRNIIDMARSGSHASSLRFLYISSIGSMQSWDHRNGSYPEEMVYDANTAVGGGYGESKYVAERIIAQSGLQATSLRVGQLCGGMPNGSWATSDWFPILVRSSLALGAIPVAEGTISWVPMNAAAQVILDVAFSGYVPPIALNLVHPTPIPWKDMIRSVRNAVINLNDLGTESLPLVPFDVWWEQLGEVSTESRDENLHIRMPAIKILPFFRKMVETEREMSVHGRHKSESGYLPDLSTKKLETISKKLRNLAPLVPVDAERWVTYWNEINFF
ncbi:acetyl-CoA synthetase-like protein [Crucibulum laeve]|uniref:Acetyl-CoA synthetase-like protein n=1 Tax=Crucibulum laeve TaxID=68775 RepID=A0A5C3LP70_9AGAR|nr:acetyl-CoA synthetase-like protein [Crucibulum laeve]